MKYKGQSKEEFDKNYKRVKDIITKSDGDEEKVIRLAKIQANLIKDENKALNRADVARELNYENIFEVFFQRAYELGSVSIQDYRNYKLEKLGI
jgi:pyruvate carboxylase